MCNTQNKQVMNAVNQMKHKERVSSYYFYGDDLKYLQCRPVRQFPGVTNLLELFAVLEQSWQQATAYPACQAEWIETDPSYGQCAVTAMLVHDMFGGTIHKIRVSGGGTHYFNKLNGIYVDLTREQFDLYAIPINYEPNQEIPREYCGKNKDTLARYKQLQRSIIYYLHQ